MAYRPVDRHAAGAKPNFTQRRICAGAVFLAASIAWLSAGGGGSGGSGINYDAHYEPEDTGSLNPPHGGRLVDLMASKERARAIVTKEAASLKSYQLSHRNLCDLEMLLWGAFSPLRGFMTSAEYDGVVNKMRLPDGTVWPMPITLDIDTETAAQVNTGDRIALRDSYFNLIAVITVEDKWTPDKTNEAKQVFRTTDQSHPGVDFLVNQAGPVYIGGPIEGVELPKHYDFNELRYTPANARAEFDRLGWTRIVAFQTRNPMHRAHIELTSLAARQIKGHPFINPIVGMTKPGDVSYAVRVRCYKAIVAQGQRYYQHGVFLGVLPLAMRMAGPREALWHAIIRKNYGASHFIVGRDHAGVKDAAGEDFYGAYDAQELVNEYKDEVGIGIVPFKKVVYVPSLDQYLPGDLVTKGVETMSISGTKFRKMMNEGADIPAWFSDPDVIKILQEVNPPLRKRGFTIMFTGLSGSGKTTISHALIQRLAAYDPARKLTVLDGDVVRTHLSKGLGFSIADRNTNVARIGYVAGEVVKHRGIGIAAPIAPFEASREVVRELVGANGGGYLLVWVSTSVEACARRDVKGLYQKAKEGSIKITGVNHPYEMPERAELTIDAERVPVEDSVDYILGWLGKTGYLVREGDVDTWADKLEADAADVLTQGQADPGAKTCDAARVEAEGKIVIGIGPYGSGLHVLRDTLRHGTSSAYPANVFTIDASDITFAEEAARSEAASSSSSGRRLLGDAAAAAAAAAEGGVAPAADAASGGAAARGLAGSAALDALEEVDKDPAFTTGTPGGNPLSESERVDVAWSIYSKVRDAALAKDSRARVATSPRLVVYARNMLRFDGCLNVVAMEPPTGDLAVKAAQGTEAQRSAYLEDYAASVKALQAAFPERVMVVGAADLRGSKGDTVRSFAGC